MFEVNKLFIARMIWICRLMVIFRLALFSETINPLTLKPFKNTTLTQLTRPVVLTQVESGAQDSQNGVKTTFSCVPASSTASPFCPHCLTWSDSSQLGCATCWEPPRLFIFTQITLIIMAVQGYQRDGLGHPSHIRSAIKIIYWPTGRW